MAENGRRGSNRVDDDDDDHGVSGEKEVHLSSDRKSVDQEESDQGQPLLFAKTLDRQDVRGQVLHIPIDLAVAHFPTPSMEFSRAKILLTDEGGRDWPMTIFTNQKLSPSYIFMKGWEEFLLHHNLQIGDQLLFYGNAANEQHYKVATIKITSANKDAQTETKLDQEYGQPLLFAKTLDRQDVCGQVLHIPVDLAVAHFPAPSKEFSRSKIILTEEGGRDWPMTIFTNQKLSPSYIFMKGWEEFLLHHNLQIGDQLLFYSSGNVANQKHYRVAIIKITSANIDVQSEMKTRGLSSSSAQNQNNDQREGRLQFAFEKQLADQDIQGGILTVPTTLAHGHFPVPTMNYSMARILVTDKDGLNWPMTMFMNTKYAPSYMITTGWEDFMGQHELKTGNLLRFYIPRHRVHQQHYVVIVSRPDEEAKARPDISSSSASNA